MQTDIKKLANAKMFTHTLLVLGGVIILAFVFHAGVMVGYHKAKFSFAMGEKYYRAFDGPRDKGQDYEEQKRGFPSAHGAIGKIIRIDLPTIIVLGPDNIEKTVLVGNDTPIRKFRGTASTSDIVLGTHVIVFGSPSADATVSAQLIRIIPPPPTR